MSTEPSALPSDAPPCRSTAPEPILECEWDKCRPLRGREKRFAGRACKDAWYEAHRPRIASAAAGAPRGASIRTLILAELMDYELHSLSALAAAAKCSDASASARLRELRAQGFRVESDLELGNVTRQHRYRLAR